jgi:hypothetical protein
MDRLKPSILMGKLKQLLPNKVSPYNDLFLSMFLIRLPPSMREAVGAGDHKMAAAKVKAMDALCDARGGSDLTVATTTASCSRSPNQPQGQGATKGVTALDQNVAHLPLTPSTNSQIPPMACASITVLGQQSLF